jgi:hypothetical protein
MIKSFVWLGRRERKGCAAKKQREAELGKWKGEERCIRSVHLAHLPLVSCIKYSLSVSPSNLINPDWGCS